MTDTSTENQRSPLPAGERSGAHRPESTLTSNANGYGTVFACAGCGKYSTSLVGKQIDGVWYCSTCPPQSVAALLDRAVDVMSALHRAIEPDLDHPEIPGIVPAAAMRTFVDALADIDRARCKLRPSPETLSVEPFPDTLVRWMTSDTWRCRCTSTGNINIKLCNYCGGCGTHRPEKAPAQKASEPRVAYNSNGDAYLVEPKASDDLIRRPTGQCSWGCYYNDNGKLVRDSACTVHGASSQSEGEQS